MAVVDIVDKYRLSTIYDNIVVKDFAGIASGLTPHAF